MVEKVRLIFLYSSVAFVQGPRTERINNAKKVFFLSPFLIDLDIPNCLLWRLYTRFIRNDAFFFFAFLIIVMFLLSHVYI